ncbi:hypothetical protein L9F63_021907 [Diploptera punctata]|uniref:Carboxylesterase type B domain-containing protein n=1 Tax=Diploptera punctata TaxID=6984 RepID=A0AAD7ZMY9_DIPPU|nr:hypothetical protein L9F63_021907 [Diploptera punctata]
MRCVYLFVMCGLLVCQADADCLLNTPQGTLLGSTWQTLQGNDFCSYQGIPYAAPPVGDLRFRGPEPPTGWDGIRNATQAGNMCMQKVLSVYYGKEDCLYLNVFTPQADAASADLLPVVMFIHGGAFVLGSGNPVSYGPHYFLDKDVVMVTINYRLGVLGFLSTGDDSSPGNYALKDQAQALRWVQENIASFGGDPDQVTIMGESAGAWSVHYHVLSPLSTGLFHGAIADSGSTLMPLAFQTDPLSVAQKKAQAAGCAIDSTERLMDCLRQMDIDSLMQSQDPQTIEVAEGFSEVTSGLYDLVWSPVKEVKTGANPEPFLLDHPYNVITSGDFNKVPLMMGTNSQEGSLFIIFNIGTQTGLDNTNAEIEQLETPFFVTKSFQRADVPGALQKIADFYLGTNHTVTPDNDGADIDIQAATDRFMEYNIEKAVRLHLESGHEEIHLYNFAYKGKYSLLSKARYSTGKQDLGVLHVDELEFLLSSGLRTDKWEQGHPDWEVLEAAVTLWTNFVKYGNPTPAGESAPQNNSQDGADPAYGIAPLKLSVDVDRFKARMDFWDSLNLAENNMNCVYVVNCMLCSGPHYNMAADKMRCVYLFVTCGLLVCQADADCLLNITQGGLIGSTWQTLHGKDFCSYQGIPYAAPPVEDLRFRAPQPPTGWDGERDATQAGNMCMQKVLSVYLGKEDCLYLNVFTPQADATGAGLLPVVMFIHGGAFILGSGNPVSYGPHYFLDKEVVMVTINYRLGVLGKSRRGYIKLTL